MSVNAAGLFLIAASPLLAQATLGTGATAGTIRDSSGALVPGATVTLTDKVRGSIRESESDSAGAFLIPSVIAGLYSLEVRKEGFSVARIDSVKIDVGALASLDVTLRLEGLRTGITVSPSSNAEIAGDSSRVASVVDSGRVQALPLNGRNLLQLALLAAGAVETAPASDVFGTNVGPPARTIVLPGMMPHSANYSINGINIRGSRVGELALNPSVAAVDQFSVEDSFLMPDKGSNAVVVNIVTKSGTNQLHGEIFEFLRNRALDARSFFSSGPEDLKRNQFGFALGGPLYKDRAWFHAFYEGLREITGFSSAAYTPTAAMFRGDFSATGQAIYDPASYVADSGTRQPFPDSRIPENRINPVARNLLNYYLPGASFGMRPSNLYGYPLKTLNDDQGGLRVDIAFSARQQLFAQLLRQRSPADRPEVFRFSGLAYRNGAELAMLQHTWSVSPRAVNVARVGFLRATAIGGNEAQDHGPMLAEIGISNTFEDRGISSINLAGYSSLGRSNGPLGNVDNTWQLDDQFNYTRAGHSVAFGIGLRYRRGWHWNANVLALGVLSFQPVFTAQLITNAQGQPAPLANTGDSFADFLLGFPVSGSVSGLPPIQFRGMQFAPFLQDSWRVTGSLTLNYGVAWSLETPPDSQGWARDAAHVFNRQTGLLEYAALGQTKPQVMETDWNNFAPRLGLSWKPRWLQATVIRAGAGIYYSEFPWVYAPYPMIGGSPASASRSLSNPQTQPVPFYTLGVNIFPPPPPGGLTGDYAANLPAGTIATVLDPTFRTAYVSQWNVSLQRSAGNDDTVVLQYLGSSAHRLPNASDITQCRPGANLFCDPATRPWPRYGFLIQADSSGNSSYHALIAKYEHRMNRGVNLRAEYVVAKALTDAWQAGLLPHSQITTCRRCSKGPANFDIRHRAVGSVIWETPFGRGRRFGSNMPRWADSIAGQWMVTGITTFSTGEPVYLVSPNQTGSLRTSHLPNRVCDGRSRLFSSTIRSNGFLWFDTSCFEVPPPGFFGNSGATVINAPGLNNWDVGVQKALPLGRERTVLQIRAEMFNTWNHAQFQQPNSDAGAGANFGRISATRSPRLVQVALKVLW